MVARITTLLVFLSLALASRLHAEGAEEQRVPLKVKVTEQPGVEYFFKWVQVAGPSVRIENPNVAVTSFTPTEAGEYQFEITVSDGGGASRKALVKKIVRFAPPPKRKPVAEPGANRAITAGQRIQIDGSKSTCDPSSKIIAWVWSQVDGPQLRLNEKLLNQREFDFDAKKPGTYVFELKVSDGETWSEPVRTSIEVTEPKVSIPPPIVESDTPPIVLPAPPGPKTPVLTQAQDMPVVKVVAGHNIKLGDEIILDGSGTTDPLNEEMEFIWDQKTDNTGKRVRKLVPDMSSAQGRKSPLTCPVWRCQPTEPGTYVFVLNVTAGKGAKQRSASSEPITFNVVDQNAPPVAEIKPVSGPFEIGETVTLDGSLSRDADGDTLEYKWKWSGEGNHPLNLIQTPAPQKLYKFVADKEGEYGIELVVNDGKADSEPARIKVLVTSSNKAPVVQINEVAGKGVINQPIQVTATVSDPENDPVTLKWTMVDGPKGARFNPEDDSKATLVFTPNERGTYRLKLTASDAKRKTEAETSVDVLAKMDRPPVAIINGPSRIELGARITLSGDRSISPEKHALTFKWEQVSGAPIPGEKPNTKTKIWEFTPKEPGEYEIKLTVSDGMQQSDKSFAFTVAKPNQAPVAAIANPPEELEGSEITLNGAGSSDPDGDPITFHWSIAEGKDALELSSATHPTPKLKLIKAGSYAVELIVSDGKLDSAPVRAVIRVKKANMPPLAEVTFPAAVMLGGEVVIDASKSSDPEDGTVASYTWTQLETNAPMLAGLTLDKSQVRFIPSKPGRYAFQVVVSDSAGLKSPPKTATVSVVETPKFPVASAELVSIPPFKAGQKVVISGARSADPTGKPLTYAWKQTQGDPGALEPKGDTLNFTPTREGDYSFELKVNNGQRDSFPVMQSFRVFSEADLLAMAGNGQGNERDPEVKLPKHIEETIALNNPPVAPPLPPVKPPEIPVPLPEKTLEIAVPPPVKTPEIPVPLPTPKDPVIPAPPPTETLPPVPPDRDPLPGVPQIPQVKVADTVPIPPPTNETPNPPKVPTEDPKNPTASVPEQPVAVITPLTGVEVGGKITLDASSSYSNIKGRDLEYRWSVVSEPANARTALGPFARKKKSLPVTLPKEGTYKFELKVYDGKNWSAPVTAEVSTRSKNIVPEAVAWAYAGYKDRDLANEDLSALPYLLRGSSITVEQNREVLLDARGSRDPDGGPNPMTFTWKLVSGAEPVSQKAEGMRMRFTPSAKGTMVWELNVFDGEATTTTKVSVEVVDPSALPVAEPLAYVWKNGENTALNELHAPTSVRGSTDPKLGVVALTGITDKNPANRKLSYTWKQVEGEDLRLRPEVLNQSRVGLKIYHPGQYRFMLTVTDTDSKFSSVPATVLVIVDEPSKPGASAKPEPKPETAPVITRVAPAPVQQSVEQLPTDVARAIQSIAAPISSIATQKEQPIVSNVTPDQPPDMPPSAKRLTKAEAIAAATPPPVEHKAVAPVEYKPVEVAVKMPEPVPTKLPEPKEAPKETKEVEPTLVSVSAAPTVERTQTDTQVAPPVPTPVVAAPVVAPIPEPVVAVPTLKQDSVGDELPPPVESKPRGIRASTRKVADAQQLQATSQVGTRPDQTSVVPAEQPWMNPSYRANDPVFQRRRPQIEALGVTGGAEAEDKLIRYLDDSDKDFRALAVLSLAKRGYSAVPALLKTLDASSAQTQAGAFEALHRISGKDLPPSASEWRAWWLQMTGGK